MSEKCSDNLYVKPLEVCNFKALQILSNLVPASSQITNSEDKYGFFSDFFHTNNPDFNCNIRAPESNNYIYKYDENKKDLCYSPNNNSNYSVNCAIIAQNPYFTYSKEKKACITIPNLKLPEGFEYEYEKDTTYMYKQDDEESSKFNYKFKNQKAYCENKWYDWIIVPNYHFGNQYEKDAGSYSKEDVRKCYKPCNKGYLPYTATNGSNICGLKANVLDGLYSNKLDYSPIALINLIGNTLPDLAILYRLTQHLAIDKYSSTSGKYTIDKELQTETDTYYTKEINNVYNKIKDVVWKDILDVNNFNIKNYQYNTKVLTYKNPLFNENDPELLTYRGMSVANMLSDAILFHTFYIADKYATYINTIIANVDKEIPVTDFNGSNNILNNIKSLIDEKVNTNLQKDLSLLKIPNTNEQNDKLKVYRHRIANIFYKAINICYDGKTDFSKNILMKTKIAIDNIRYNSIIKNYYKLEDTNIDTLKAKETIEVIYYENDDEIKIIPKSNTEENKKQANDVTNMLLDKSKIVFFTIEDNERTNKCQVGQISVVTERDLLDKVKKTECKECSTVCSKKDSNDTCKTNPDCAIFCKDNCKTDPPKPINKCGVKKADKEKTQPIKTTEINTPIDENNISSIYNFSYAFKIAIKIFFSAIILYLCYIFFQLYGETIFTFINFIFYYFTMGFYFIRFGFNKNNVEFQYHMDEYTKQNAINKYDRLVTKANSIKVPA
jgi:hypothetical protein